MYKAPTNKFTFSQPENEYIMLDSTEQFCARLLKDGLSLWMKMRTNEVSEPSKFPSSG
jgi:hypothetical protein